MLRLLVLILEEAAKRLGWALPAVVVALVITCPSPLALAQGTDPPFRVVVHPANTATGVDRKFLANGFLKEVTRWSDGEPIRPVDLKPENPVRKRFSDAVLKRSVAAVKSYWQQRIFSGRGVPPPELESEEEVVKYVREHRGGVGYVSPAADVGKVKILRIE